MLNPRKRRGSLGQRSKARQATFDIDEVCQRAQGGPLDPESRAYLESYALNELERPIYGATRLDSNTLCDAISVRRGVSYTADPYDVLKSSAKTKEQLDAIVATYTITPEIQDAYNKLSDELPSVRDFENQIFVSDQKRTRLSCALYGQPEDENCALTPSVPWKPFPVGASIALIQANTNPEQVLEDAQFAGALETLLWPCKCLTLRYQLDPKGSIIERKSYFSDNGHTLANIYYYVIDFYSGYFGNTESRYLNNLAPGGPEQKKQFFEQMAPGMYRALVATKLPRATFLGNYWVVGLSQGYNSDAVNVELKSVT